MHLCSAKDADFRESNLRSSDLRSTDFKGALFHQTQLGGADFTDATHMAIDVKFNEVTQAKFNRHEALNLLSSLDIELVD